MLLCNVSNATEPSTPIYIPIPTGAMTNLFLTILYVTLVAPGCVGNCFVFYFLHKKKSATKSRRFIKNLSLYLRSLALSDIFCVVSVPLVCFQFYFDVFKRGWICRIIRYINMAFPSITINNLVVISVDKYFSTRKVPHTFSISTVRKMILLAWLFGSVLPLVSAGTFTGVRYNLNKTHFTVICKNDNNLYPFRVSIFVLPVQFIIPGVVIIYINICLLKTILERKQIGDRKRSNNTFSKKLKASKVRGTTMLIALTFSFIVPYFFHVSYIIFRWKAKVELKFSTDYIISRVSAGVVLSNSTINFIIYMVQMNAFRSFMKEQFLSLKGSDARKQSLGGKIVISPVNSPGGIELTAYKRTL